MTGIMLEIKNINMILKSCFSDFSSIFCSFHCFINGLIFFLVLFQHYEKLLSDFQMFCFVEEITSIIQFQFRFQPFYNVENILFLLYIVII